MARPETELEKASRDFIATVDARPTVAELALASIYRLEATRDPRAALPLLLLLWPRVSQIPDSTGLAWLYRRLSRPDPLHSIRRRAEQAFARLIEGLEPEALPAFDEHVRRISGKAWSLQGRDGQWLFVRPPSPRQVDAGAATEALLCVLASSRDGHVREAAIRALGIPRSVQSMAVTIWRAGDWVPQVAQAAAQVASSALANAKPEELGRTLPLIARLRSLFRAPTALLSQFDARMFEAGSRGALSACLSAASKAGRREAASLMTRAPWWDEAALSDLLASVDSVVRRSVLALDPAVRRLDPIASRPLLDKLLSDRDPSVRAAALQASVAAARPDIAEVLRSRLFDPSTRVRTLAAFWLGRTMPKSELASLLRAQLDRPGTSARVLKACAAGLGELGDASDMARLRQLVASTPSLARVALRSMHALDPMGTRPELFQRLGDARLGVSKTAFDLLPAGFGASDSADLWQAWLGAEGDDARRRVALAALRLPPWSGLFWLLQATIEYSDATVDALAQWRPEPDRWYAPTPPTGAERTLLIASLDRAALDPATRSRLLSAIQAG